MDQSKSWKMMGNDPFSNTTSKDSHHGLQRLKRCADFPGHMRVMTFLIGLMAITMLIRGLKP
jgi:hypothetical protein